MSLNEEQDRKATEIFYYVINHEVEDEVQYVRRESGGDPDVEAFVWDLIINHSMDLAIMANGEKEREAARKAAESMDKDEANSDDKNSPNPATS